MDKLCTSVPEIVKGFLDEARDNAYCDIANICISMAGKAFRSGLFPGFDSTKLEDVSQMCQTIAIVTMQYISQDKSFALFYDDTTIWLVKLGPITMDIFRQAGMTITSIGGVQYIVPDDNQHETLADQLFHNVLGN